MILRKTSMTPTMVASLRVDALGVSRALVKVAFVYVNAVSSVCALIFGKTHFAQTSVTPNCVLAYFSESWSQ